MRNVYILWCLTWRKTNNINKLSRVRSTDWKSLLSDARQPEVRSSNLKSCFQVWLTLNCTFWKYTFFVFGCPLKFFKLYLCKHHQIWYKYFWHDILWTYRAKFHFTKSNWSFEELCFFLNALVTMVTQIVKT